MQLDFPETENEDTLLLRPLPPEGGTQQPDRKLGLEAAGSTRPLPPDEERQRVCEQEEFEKSGGLQAGKQYYIISRRWHVEWLQYVGHQSVQSPKQGPSPDPFTGLDSGSPQLGRQRSWTKDRPGPIDNKPLVDPTGQDALKLRRDIQEHADYEILSEEIWQLLHSWYGGGPPIERRAILQTDSTVVVELYGLTLKVHRSTDLDAGSATMIESKTTTVGDFKKRVCAKFGLDNDKCRIWDYFNKKKYAPLENKEDQSLNECRIFEDNDILVEQKLADGSWPPDETKTTVSNISYGSRWDSSYSTDEDVVTTGTPAVKGAVGLQNLGNTCFMNSSLQCLSNIPELRDYFTEDAWRENKNETAYKTKGELAEAYSALLRKMWSSSTVQVAPRNFKYNIGQFAGQFAGYGQQDSMEFIEYFIDGLKEDVNEVTGAKPFVELKEAEGRPDEVVANEALENYQKRNHSRVDSLFLGFHKSTVECPEPGCGRVSVTFDPYLSVKLSLVSATEERNTSFDVYIVPQASSSETLRKQRVSVSKYGNTEDLIEAASKQHGLDARSCILTEYWSKKIYKFFEKNDGVDGINKNDILVLYEMRSESEMNDFSIGSDKNHYNSRSSTTATTHKSGLVIYNRQVSQSTYSSYSSSSSSQLDCLPFITCVSNRISGKDLIDVVKSELAKRIGPLPDDGWKLYRTSDKNSLSSSTSSNSVMAVEQDDTLIELEQRMYMIMEWREGVELPEALSKLVDEMSTSKGNDNAGDRASSASTSLEACFDMYVEKDKLSADDTWYCNRCKEMREAYKKMEFWTFPPVLVVQLKRFTYTQYSRERLDTAIAFPLEGLDLTKFRTRAASDGEPQRLVYDLFAVSKHIGHLGGGHYVAYARSPENGKWYLFDDSSVCEVSANDVTNDQVGAYVLFYIRRDKRPPAWGEPKH